MVYVFGFGRQARSSDAAPYCKDGPDLQQPAQEPECKTSLPEVIESLGTGLAQVRTALLAGPVWFADGAELILISSVANTVASEWNFGHFQRGMVVTLVYLGVLFGNAMSGPAGDHFGRRLPILISFICIFIFSVLSAMAWGFWSLGLFRLLVGWAIGFGQPAQQAMVSEITPTKWRIVFSSAGMYLFAAGEVYSGFLLLADDPNLVDVHWRTLLIAAAIPSLVFGVLALAFLNQSPLFLACGGRESEAQEVLASMRRDNNAMDVSIDFKPHRVLCGGSGAQTHFVRMLRIVFGREHRVTTLVLALSAFQLNLAYYGSLYAFPLVMAGGVSIGSNAATGLIYGALMEFAGYTVGILCILYCSRIGVMKIYLLTMGISLTVFAICAPKQGGGALIHFGVMLGYFGTKFTVCIGFLVFYLYASEVYPTAARATGTAVVFAAGRLASMTSPLVYEFIVKITGSFPMFFWLMAALCAVNLLAMRFLTVETFGMVLREDDTAPEDAADASAGYGSVPRPSVFKSSA